MTYKFCFALIIFAVTASPVFGQTRAQEGAVKGGLAGAIIGGIAGHQNDETPEGIAIGAAVGAIAGGLMGKEQDNQRYRDYHQQQYQIQQQRKTVQYRQQQVSRAVSMSDAVTLCRSGLSNDLICSQIRANGVQQRIGVQEIIMLHENGVSEVVIREMQNARIAGQPTAPAVVVQERRPTIVVERPAPVIVERYHTPVYHPPVRYGHRHRYIR